MFSGVLKKMVSIHDNPVRYIMDFDDDFWGLDQLESREASLVLPAPGFPRPAGLPTVLGHDPAIGAPPPPPAALPDAASSLSAKPRRRAAPCRGRTHAPVWTWSGSHASGRVRPSMGSGAGGGGGARSAPRGLS